MRPTLGLLLACAACRAAPALPEGLTWVESTNDPLQWQRAGFIELTTPVRPPTSPDGTARIVVVLRPKQGVGTVAARVEYAGSPRRDDPVGADWQVLDVRQFEWTSAGLRCSVLRPSSGHRLAGVAWPCGLDMDARAGRALAELANSGHLRGPGERLAKLNACTGCHRPHRAEDRRPQSLVQRGTDADGLFSLRSLWSDEDAVERYRPVATNDADPFLSPVCPAGTVTDAGTCDDGTWPRLRLAVEDAVAAGDPHALRVCAARRALAAALGAPRGTPAIQAALDACGP